MSKMKNTDEKQNKMRIKLKFSRSFLVLASNNITALISNVRRNISIESQCHIEILCQFYFFPAISRSMVHERTSQPTEKKKHTLLLQFMIVRTNQTKNRLNSLCEMAEYCIVIFIVLNTAVAVAVVIFLNSHCIRSQCSIHQNGILTNCNWSE